MNTVKIVPETFIPSEIAQQFKKIQESGTDSQEYLTDLQVTQWNKRVGELIHYDCPICKNRGDIAYKTEHGLFALRQCACITKRRAHTRAIKSGMAELLGKSFGNFCVDSEYQRNLRDTGIAFWRTIKKGEHKWLCLLGQSGCGKTHICSAVINNLLKDGYNCRYMMWTHEIGELKRNAVDRERYDELYDELIRAPVLYIDDLFKGDVTPADRRITFDILNFRANNRLITLISSEMYLREIDKIDSGIAGRINQMSAPYVLETYRSEDKNYRMK